MVKATPQDLAADIVKSIAELQERLRMAKTRERQITDLQEFIDARPLLTKGDVLRIGRALPTVREVPDGHIPPRLPGGRRHNRDAGDAIKAAREAKGLSREQLSKKLGVHNSSVGYWERGHGYPDTKRAKKIAALLNLPVATLTPPDGPRAKGKNNGRSTGKPAKSAAHAKAGKAIAAAREAMGFQQVEFAKKMRVSLSSVYAWEAGHWSPAGEVADRLGKLLAIPVDQLRPPVVNGAAPH